MAAVRFVKSQSCRDIGLDAAYERYTYPLCELPAKDRSVSEEFTIGPERRYEYQPSDMETDAERAVSLLRSRVPNRVVRGWVPSLDPDVLREISAHFAAQGTEVKDLPADAGQFATYLARADYSGLHPTYYPSNRTEKAFEHWICLRLLDLGPSDRFVDIASEGSPLPDIVGRLTGAVSFAQDIMYPPGIHGSRIGGDACHLPVAAGFASKAALTCSLEHFEATADIELFRELSRVLEPGGRVCVVPLYLYSEAAAQTDPRYSARCDVPFDANATVFCADGWGNRHGRFYSALSLHERILRPHAGAFAFSVYRLSSTDVISPEIYARWALVARRA